MLSAVMTVGVAVAEELEDTLCDVHPEGDIEAEGDDECDSGREWVPAIVLDDVVEDVSVILVVSVSDAERQ